MPWLGIDSTLGDANLTSDITNKVRVICLQVESIENKILVYFRDLHIHKPHLLGQVHLSWNRTGVQPQCTGVQLEV